MRTRNMSNHHWQVTVFVRENYASPLLLQYPTVNPRASILYLFLDLRRVRVS
jgi:hypothetical protein